MKFFTNQKFWIKLIVSMCLCLIIFNFGMTNVANAETPTTEVVSAVGGVLIDAICGLIMSLGDGIMSIIQNSIMGTEATVIVDAEEGLFNKIVAGVALALTIVVGAYLLYLYLPGLLIVVAKKLAKIVLTGVAIGMLVEGSVNVAYNTVKANLMSDIIVLPTFTIGPEEIFSGNILLFDGNIFNPKEVYVRYGDSYSSGNIMSLEKWNKKTTNAEGDTVYPNQEGKTVQDYFFFRDGNTGNTDSSNITITSVNNSAQELKDTIAKWYYAIRNLTLVGMMIVLVYVGIRILITSVAADKAKYKQMLVDWLVALCLVFLMQYIMVFANSFVDSVTTIFSTISNENKHIAAILLDSDNKLIEEIKNLGYEDLIVTEGNEKVLTWPTNLMGRFRIEAQEHDGSAEYVGYAICYLLLVMYTAFFAFTYLRRLLYLLFFTIIAPLVALTYPIDKINDGKAQAFNTWLREYIFNLLIQPFHLLLYTVFVSMAFELAGTNIIYSLVVLGFLIPAEKFLRGMFGFNKASTPGFLAGAGGAAMVISGMQSLNKFAGGGKGKAGSGSDEKESEKDDSKVRTSDSGYSTNSLVSAAIAGSDQDNSSANQGGGAAQNSAGNPELPSGNDESNNEEADNNGGWHPDLTQDQIDELQAEGIEPGDQEYEQALANYGIRNNALGDEGENNNGGWHPDLTQDQIDELQAEGIEPGDQEYAQALANYGINDNSLNVSEEGNDSDDENVPETGDDSADEFEETQTGSIRNRVGNVARGASGYMAAMGSNFVRDNLNAKKIKGVVKNAAGKGASTVFKAGLGATGAIIGATAGIASGDIGNVFKYGTSGAYTGGALGKGLSNRFSKEVDQANQKFKKMHEETLRTQYGDKEYERMQNEKLDKEFLKDKDNRRLYARKLGLTNEEDINIAMNQAIEFRRNGVQDNETIIKAMKLSTDPNQRASSMNIAAAKLAPTAKSQKDFDTLAKKLEERQGSKTAKQELLNRIREINKDSNLL